MSISMEERSNSEIANEVRRARDVRTLLPELGLKEYWYPAIEEKKIGKKPVLVTMLGQEVCFFRGKSNKVVAIANACPHRGAQLSSGNCDFNGTVSCFYHGFVFDEEGLCVATFGEGPTSPMIGKLRARTYPTFTSKGVIFVWMGDGEPAPLSESLPEDFFDEDMSVFCWTNSWAANWRPAVENYGDSHVRYVHRNSLIQLMRPIMPPHLPLPGRPRRVGPHRLAAGGFRDGGLGRPKSDRPYQDFYPLLGAQWPKHKWRFAWTWFFMWYKQVEAKWRPMQKVSEEWGTGQHLPSIVRLNYGTHIYTRWAVPADANTTRNFYFHAAKRGSAIGKFHEWAYWRFWRNWAMNKNFSEQDKPGAINLRYDLPERLSITDQQTIEWRKMVLTARGMPGYTPYEQPPPTESNGHDQSDQRIAPKETATAEVEAKQPMPSSRT